MTRVRSGLRFLKILSSGLLLCALGILGVSCSDPEAVRVQLQARPVSKETSKRFEIQAQIAGNPAGLRYRWFSVSGTCDPQETDLPSTVFRFAEGVKSDRVTVQVFRGGKPVGKSEIDLKFDEERERLSRENPPKIDVEITLIPPHEPGGADTRADIAGKVTGDFAPELIVLIYARAYDSWHIQPTALASHPIQDDGTWKSWTHTGTSYAALVVRPEYDPLVRADVLPRVGGYVLARTVVDGKRK